MPTENQSDPTALASDSVKTDSASNVSVVSPDPELAQFLEQNLLNVLPYMKNKEPFVDLGDMDNAPAVMFVIDRNMTTKALTNKFLLTSVQESRQEKSQIIETFGLPSFYFFGERTKVYHFAGSLLETDAQVSTSFKNRYLWASSLTELYDKMLRGTKLAELNYEAVLVYKNYRLYGYPINLNLKHDANAPKTAGFSFSMIVRKQEFINDEGISGLYKIEQFGSTDAKRQELKDVSEELDEIKEALVNQKEAFLEELGTYLGAIHPAVETLFHIRKDEIWKWLKKSSEKGEAEVPVADFAKEFYSAPVYEPKHNMITEALNLALEDKDLPKLLSQNHSLLARFNRLLQGERITK